MTQTDPTAPVTGRCGTALSDWGGGYGATICALPADHAGWHRSDQGTEWRTATPDPFDAHMAWSKGYERGRLDGLAAGMAAGRTQAAADIRAVALQRCTAARVIAGVQDPGIGDMEWAARIAEEIDHG